MINPQWYQRTTADTLTKLGSSPDGLTGEQAREKLQRFGPNEIELKTRGPLIRFLLQFHNPLLYVLLVAAAVALFLGKILDMWVILAVVLATVIIGFVQEGRAEQSIQALRRMMVPQCLVLRDGQKNILPSRELVPGDIVLLESGDRVPADLRLLNEKNFALDESMLTGESIPLAKKTEPLELPNLSPGDQKNMAFSGTFVSRGNARGIVVATGKHTEIGKISGIIADTTRTTPPIMRHISEFTKLIMISIFLLSAVNFLVGWRLGYETGYIFLASVGMIVAMVPEGLPAALVAAFSLGVTTLARQNTLIRRLPAVETLGCTTVICSDKTGTLTKNQMTVSRVYSGGREFRVTGTGYKLSGGFFHQSDNTPATLDMNSNLETTLRAGYLCNNASLVRDNEDKASDINGDPTEGALLVAAAKGGITIADERLDEIPFEPDLQYMATLNRGANKNTIYLKGSPEKVLSMCASQLADSTITPLNLAEVSASADAMAGDALRVLGFAYKEVPPGQTTITSDDLTDMVFLGLQGMIDPPREEAAEAVSQCMAAGIRVVMITGDHARTARAIAGQLHIGLGEQRTVTGAEVEALTDDELFAVVEYVSVFARAAPEHKYRIVRQLQRHGHIVAVTGDGVNDAPALTTADIGIAMGITGTQVAKEASDMVLTDDNFASIVKAVEEGRHIFNNIWKVILFLLPTNGGQGLVLLGAVALAPFIPVFAQRLPVEPIQILWVNLIISIACAIPLTREPKDDGILHNPPRDPKMKLVNATFIWKVALVSVISATAAFTMFLLYSKSMTGQTAGDVLTQAQTVAFTTIIFVQLAYLGAARGITTSSFRIKPFSNPWLVAGALTTLGLQLLIVYAQPIFGFSPFRTEPFPLHWWLYISAAALPGFLVIELEKLVRRRLARLRA